MKNETAADRCLAEILTLWRRLPANRTAYGAQKCEALGIEAAIYALAQQYKALTSGPDRSGGNRAGGSPDGE